MSELDAELGIPRFMRTLFVFSSSKSCGEAVALCSVSKEVSTTRMIGSTALMSIM